MRARLLSSVSHGTLFACRLDMGRVPLLARP